MGIIISFQKIYTIIKFVKMKAILHLGKEMLMNFTEILNQLIEELQITGRELSEASGLAPAIISRYRAGGRMPSPGSRQLEQLVFGLTTLVKEKDIDLEPEQLLLAVSEAQNRKTQEYERFLEHFNLLLDLLQIPMKELAGQTGYDITHLYRIRTGKRRPKDIPAFADALCKYVVRSYRRDDDIHQLCRLIDCDRDTVSTPEKLHRQLVEWLVSGEKKTDHQLDRFLHALDEFDLDDYIESIRFNDLRVPTAPFRLPHAKIYYGIEEMRQSELDFFKATALSKSTESVFMCNDMPMVEMAENMDFNKKWMFGIAAALKKGLHLDIIHDINRPFSELMLGLEAWIPIYMTGQISPYYLPRHSIGTYHHALYVSGACALSGECIHGFHNDGRYYLTNSREERAYARRRSENLLRCAKPLMNIYNSTKKEAFRLFLEQNGGLPCGRRNILSIPPLYTLSQRLLEEICDSNSVSDERRKQILALYESQRTEFERALTGTCDGESESQCITHSQRDDHKSALFSSSDNGIIEWTDELSLMDEEHFRSAPASLSLSNAFTDFGLTYTYEQYQAHIRLTGEKAAEFDRYHLSIVPAVFRNIDIHIFEGHFVVISKNNPPAIQFVIHHPKMVQAFANFFPVRLPNIQENT